MDSAFEYVFVHGFRMDVPDRRGAILEKWFRQKGIELHQLDAKGGKGHEDATITICLEALEDYRKSKGRPLRLIGMSMGGLMSALYASRNPTHVDRIILLNPAVNLKVGQIARYCNPLQSTCRKHGERLQTQIIQQHTTNGRGMV